MCSCVSLSLAWDKASLQVLHPLPYSLPRHSHSLQPALRAVWFFLSLPFLSRTHEQWAMSVVDTHLQAMAVCTTGNQEATNRLISMFVILYVRASLSRLCLSDDALPLPFTHTNFLPHASFIISLTHTGTSSLSLTSTHSLTRFFRSHTRTSGSSCQSSTLASPSVPLRTVCTNGNLKATS